MSNNPKLAYLPIDRTFALMDKSELPEVCQGTALFADISGFTPLTENLRRIQGARQGVESLTRQLNAVYEGLIAEVHQAGGSIIEFSGDAITCWFDSVHIGDEVTAAHCAIGCAVGMQRAMQDFAQIELEDGTQISLGCKIGIASGNVRRLVVGEPKFRLFDVLIGSTIDRMSQAESLGQRGEVIADSATIGLVQELVDFGKWRTVPETGDAMALVIGLSQPSQSSVAWSRTDLDNFHSLHLDEWLLPDVQRQLDVGLGEYPPELRSVVALFMRFTGFDYEDDESVGGKLNSFIKWAQGIVYRYGGNIIQVSIEHKGSYLYAVFGAPLSHEEDTYRAVSAALELSQPAKHIKVQIGISQGVMRTGAYGSKYRRTYGVQGDEVNLAARLMQHAQSGTVMVSGHVRRQTKHAFEFQDLPDVSIKGKQDLISLAQLIQRRRVTTEEISYAAPFVGRNNEFEQLEIWAEPIFAENSAGIIYVRGEAGIGKSRFLDEFRHRLQQKHHVQWFVAPANEVMPLALNPFTHWLKQYFKQRADQSPDENLAAFQRVFYGFLHTIRLSTVINRELRMQMEYSYPFLAALLGLPVRNKLYQNVTSNFRMEQFVSAVQTLILAESQLQPVVLLVEDSQWLDNISRQLIQQLARNAPDYPLAIILTSRHNKTQTQQHMAFDLNVSQHDLDLGQLDTAGVRQLGEEILNGALDDKLVAFLDEKTMGNPFFVEQMIFDLQERQAIAQKDNIWRLELAKMDELLPDTINTVLIARLDRLTAQVKAVVQAASVLGNEFEVDILANMLQRQDTQRRVQEAEQEGIWLAIKQLIYLFRHALLRDAAYAMQVEARRRILHELAAQAIEILHPNDETQKAQIAQHWFNAHQFEKAIDYTLQAVEYLNIVGDYQEIERLTSQILKIKNDTPETLFYRVKLLDGLANSHNQRSNLETAYETYHEMLNIAEQLGDDKEIALALRGISRTCWQRGIYDEALSCNDQALSISEDLDNPELHSDNLSNQACIIADLGDHTTAIEYFTEALAIKDKINDIVGQSAVLNSLTASLTRLGRYDEVIEYCQQSLNLAQDIGYQMGVANVLVNLANAWGHRGDYEKFESYALQSLDKYQTLGNQKEKSAILNNLGYFAEKEGYDAQAITYLQDSLAISRQLNDLPSVANTLINIAYVTFAQKNLHDTYGYLAESLATCYPIQYASSITENLVFCGRIHYEIHTNWERAVRLLGLTQQMKGVSHDILQNYLLPVLESIQDAYASDKVEALLDEGADLDYDTVIREELEFLQKAQAETK